MWMGFNSIEELDAGEGFAERRVVLFNDTRIIDKQRRSVFCDQPFVQFLMHAIATNRHVRVRSFFARAHDSSNMSSMYCGSANDARWIAGL